MIKLIDAKASITGGAIAPVPAAAPDAVRAGREKTMAYKILRAHSRADGNGALHVKFDSLISHDITYVGVIQTARACGLKSFPVPYALTNCHNSLCAVGGTINEDDHMFGLSAARKYGGVYVPANQAVLHQYAREMMSRVGGMILGSDSHTRYGALGTMGFGEGGPEIVKQLLQNTYDIPEPEAVLVYLTGAPRRGVGPHDVAIALCGAVYKNGFVKNRVLEFCGPGVSSLPMDFRLGIDVMTTETACLSSIWVCDETVKGFYQAHGRAQDYAPLSPEDGAMYDRAIEIDLSRVEPMIALPFHPSNAYTLREFCANPADILRECEKNMAAQMGGKASCDLVSKVQNGRVCVDQGIIAGCAGGMYDNIREAAAILAGKSVGNGAFSLSVYPSSMPINLALLKDGTQGALLEAGALFKPCFCGPCFGAGDVPSNNALSIRHTTRNFANREGSRPADGQIASVALMDARSIAATAANGGVLTSALEMDYQAPGASAYRFDRSVYEKRVYFGFGKPQTDQPLHMAPSIADWPPIAPLKDNLLVRLVSVLRDPVTTTDELIPSGETSSYRSNPMNLAEFTLSRRDPGYVSRAKAVKALSEAEISEVLSKVESDASYENTSVGSVIFANRPGDGSAREQAASCQRVLGGAANICYDFATKRYRSNCINWGMLPFTLDEGAPFEYEVGDYVFVPGIRAALEKGLSRVEGTVITAEGIKPIALNLNGLTADDREILLRGCLMNFYAARAGKGE